MIQLFYVNLEIIVPERCSYVNYTLFCVGIKSNLILQKLPSLHNKIEKIIITRRTCRTYSSEIN